jgi:hypothetical protein
MALDFPNTPTNGQIFTTGDGSWLWDTVKWKSGNGVGFLTTIADTPPPVPTPGLLWWNSSPGIGQLYVYYNDGTSSQWVTANNMGGGLYLPLTGGTIGVQPATGPGPNALLINDTVGAPQPGMTGQGRFITASEGTPVIGIDSYGTNPAYMLTRRSRGTAAAPTALLSGDLIGNWTFQGANGAATYTGAAAIYGATTENWSSTANGTRLILATAPAGGTAQVNSLTLNGNNATFSGNIVQPTNGAHYFDPNATTTSPRIASNGGNNGGGISFNVGNGANNNFVFNNNAGTILAEFTPATPYTTYNQTGSWSSLSDPRVKTDITPYERGLAAILQLNPINFRYNGELGAVLDDPETTRIGLDASAVEAVMPEMVGRKVNTAPDGTPYDEILTLETGPLIYALVNAVKELKAEIDALKSGMH